MDAVSYEAYGIRLREMKKELELDLVRRERASRRQNLAGDLPTTGDQGDNANLSNNQDVNLKVMTMRSEDLQRVDAALARHEKKEYGYCVECGKEIEEKRLDACLWAIRCKDCHHDYEEAKAIEERQKRRKGFKSS